MALLNVIEWVQESPDEILHKADMRKNIVKRGSKLTVREGQVAIFCDKGRVADVFAPGMYSLNTDTLPILTALLSWAYAFESPFKSDIYFINTAQITNRKWGTSTPVIIKDEEFGAVRVRGYGTYSFRVKNAPQFLKELSGARSSFNAEDVQDYIRSIVVMSASDALGESNVPVTAMSANLAELSEVISNVAKARMEPLGLELSAFNFENISLPDAVQKALDENVRLGILRDNADLYTKIARADAIKAAAENSGGMGTALSAGIGLGVGADLGKKIGEEVKEGQKFCPACGSSAPTSANFCPVCGHKL